MRASPRRPRSFQTPAAHPVRADRRALLLFVSRLPSLRRQDCVNETMLREECQRLHAACTEALVGVVDDAQLAHHHEMAGASSLSRRVRLALPALSHVAQKTADDARRTFHRSVFLTAPRMVFAPRS